MNLNPIYRIQTKASATEQIAWGGFEQKYDIEDGYAILWEHHHIFVGVVKGGVISWIDESALVPDSKHLLELRVFDKSKEYFFWKTPSGSIQGRKRQDDPVGEADAVEFVDTEMLLRAVVAKPLYEVLGTVQGENIFLKTRNYIGQNDIGQVGYVDSRMVNFLIDLV